MIKENNYDFIRLIAAILVTYSHSFPLTGNLNEPFASLTKGTLDFGSLGVWIFFTISGFLITKSYVERDNLKLFLKARFLRIVPALVPVILLSVFLVGPLVTNISMGEYFSSSRTWEYLQNMVPIKRVYYNLPGVFSDFPNTSINGSLWTLPLELQCYIIVSLCGYLSILRRLQNNLKILGVFFLVFILCFIYYDVISHNVKVQAIFLFGSFGYLLRVYIPWNFYLVLICLFSLFVTGCYGYIILGWYLFGTYLVLYLSQNTLLKTWKFMNFGDLSYGIYIYSFPVQQLIIYLYNGKIGAFQNFIISLPIVLCCSFLSWNFVEKKALKLVHR